MVWEGHPANGKNQQSSSLFPAYKILDRVKAWRKMKIENKFRLCLDHDQRELWMRSKKQWKAG